MRSVVASDGLELVCHEAGRSDGRVAVLLHGLTGTASIWDDTAPALAPRFRVLMLDMRGHGASGRTDSATDFTIERLSADVVDLLDSVQVAGATVVGHGLGGTVTQVLGLEHPDRVEAMVLVGTGPGPLDAGSGWAKTRASLADVAERRGIEAAWDHYVESGLIGWELDEVPAEIVERWRSEFVKTAPAALAGLVRSSAAQRDRTAELSAIRCPVLVVAGDDDAAFGEAAKVLAAALADGEFVSVVSGGHSPHVSKADEFNEVVMDFLRRRLPARRR